MNILSRSLGILAFTVAPVAMGAIIDFENLSEGTIVDNEYVASYGVDFNGVNVDRRRENLAVVFDTTNQNSRDNDLEAPFNNIVSPELGIANPGNVLIIHENPSSCNAFICANPDDEGSRPAGYFEINFNQSVTLDSIDFFDIEDAENGFSASNAIRLFDVAGSEIGAGSFFTPHTGGDNTWNRLAIGVEGVSSVRIGLKGSGAIDNIAFSVPEPSTFVLLFLGLLGLGLSRRKTLTPS